MLPNLEISGTTCEQSHQFVCYFLYTVKNDTLNLVYSQLIHSQKELAHWTVDVTAQIYACYFSS